MLSLDAETRAAERPEDHKDELRLWLRMLTCTTLVEAQIRRRLRVAFGLTLPRFDLMAQLERAPEGLTLGELSRRLMVSNGNVTGLVERLAERGQVARVPHKVDRRVVLVRLTEAGRTEFSRMARAHAGWVGALFEGLSAEEVQTLMGLLGRVKQSVRSAR